MLLTAEGAKGLYRRLLVLTCRPDRNGRQYMLARKSDAGVPEVPA
jgi:hypothetical protein